VMRTYSEWLGSDNAWSARSQIPEEGTTLGIILSSDKTSISSLTGDRSAHPLLISLANIDPDFRSKASNNAFLLLALLPIPKFVETDKKVRSLLDKRLMHQNLDIVLHPLKIAAQIGIMLSDPVGAIRCFYTPCAAYIVDTPEAADISCVGGKTSPYTVATYKQFGDNFRHNPRTAAHTLNQLNQLRRNVDPNDLPAYSKASKKLRLNGVHEPFWRDWALSDPSNFLMPEPLHHWHKMFWDHDVKWVIAFLGETETDFRFSILPIRTAFKHFNGGISALKQVTGREQRDIQRFILPILAGAGDPRFTVVVRCLLEFRYLAQAPQLHETNLSRLKASLNLFHRHKHIVLDPPVAGRLIYETTVATGHVGYIKRAGHSHCAIYQQSGGQLQAKEFPARSGCDRFEKQGGCPPVRDRKSTSGCRC
ncbi:hypothetical protein BDN72DRAFT_779026, partial [Pluteus cervinus]